MEEEQYEVPEGSSIESKKNKKVLMQRRKRKDPPESKKCSKVLMQCKKKRKDPDPRESKKSSKVLMQWKKRKVPVPRELMVLKDIIDLEDLKRYFFPETPLEAWREDDISKELDDPFGLLSASLGAEYNHVLCVTNKLGASIMKEFQRPKFYLNKTNMNPGESFDIESLLFPNRNDYLVRRNGSKVRAKSLKGKYIMVCVSYAPIAWASNVWKMVYGCSEMYSKLKGMFEMVIVIKMRRGWTHDRDAFDQFFSAFPSSCLAVPFLDRSRRYLVCKALGGTCDLKIFLVDPNGIVLLHKNLGCLMDLRLVPLNRSDPSPFPFISRKFVRNEANPPLPLWKLRTPSSLEELLCCETSNYVFRNIYLGNGAFRKEEVSISELKSKLVGLYLYDTGHKFPLLHKISQECKHSDKELEIVMVCVNIYSRSQSTLEIFSRVLAKRGITWWVAPFNFTAAIVLKQLFEFEGEKVIIVGPNDLCVDIRGVELMMIYGIKAYPFTIDFVVQKTVEELRQVTLDSFLKLLEIPEYHPIAKKVLFYIDIPEEICPAVYNAFIHFFRYEDVDIHVISLVDSESFQKHAKKPKLQPCDSKDFTLKLRWHTKGADNCWNFFLWFFNHEFPTIVAFGEDGRICSVLAHELPYSDRPEIKANLLKEVSSILENYLKDYDRKEFLYEGYDHDHESLQELRRSRFW